jgi:hypothetical protein
MHLLNQLATIFIPTYLSKLFRIGEVTKGKPDISSVGVQQYITQSQNSLPTNGVLIEVGLLWLSTWYPLIEQITQNWLSDQIQIVVCSALL